MIKITLRLSLSLIGPLPLNHIFRRSMIRNVACIWKPAINNRGFATKIAFQLKNKAAKSVLFVEDNGVNLENNSPRTSFKLKDAYKNLDLEYHVGQYILCSKITGYLETYDRYATFFNPYFNSFLYLGYLTGWCYIFITNISL